MIFARRRSSFRSRPLSAPNTVSAVRSWMSSPRRNASMSASSPDEVREHAQLDLRVVGRDQHVARARRRTPRRISRPSSRADRDVLQVRIAAAQAPGRGHRLVEARCARGPVSRVHELRQRVDVGALQLLQRRATRGSGAAARATSASSSSTSTAVDAVLRLAGPLERRQLQLLEQDLRRAAAAS